MLNILHITTECNELNIVRTMFQEYAGELNEDLCFQSFSEELQDPLKKYGPPGGSLLLAKWNNQPAGCIALLPQQNGCCEMKRLYVRPQYRRLGIGDDLIKVVLKEAEKKGYTKMVLDTLQRLQSAIRLYEKYGFKNTSAYYNNPLSGVVYMEKLFQPDVIKPG